MQNLYARLRIAGFKGENTANIQEKIYVVFVNSRSKYVVNNKLPGENLQYFEI
jgi:hypothetical protein